jgi:hypothetical protein
MARTCRRCRRKIWLLLLSYAAVCVAALALDPHDVAMFVAPLGLVGIFATGVMYTYGFTSGLALVAAPIFGLVYPAITVALVGGAGAALADTSILVFLREKMAREIREVAQSRFFRLISRLPLLGHPRVKAALGVAVLASPLPDEIGVALIAAGGALSTRMFVVASFAANALGLWVLARIGQAVL